MNKMWSRSAISACSLRTIIRKKFIFRHLNLCNFKIFGSIAHTYKLIYICMYLNLIGKVFKSIGNLKKKISL